MALNRRQVLALSKTALLTGTLAGCSAPSNSANPTATPRPQGTPEASPTPTATSLTTPSPPDEPLTRLTYGNTAFALDLLDRSTDANPRTNLLVSPYSIGVALAMTYAGARGDTRSQIRDTLQFTLDEPTLHSTFHDLQRSLTTRETVASFEPRRPTAHTPTDESAPFTPFELVDANTLWGQQGFPYNESFLNLLESEYGAGLRQVDFKTHPEAARTEINDWVIEQTHGKIPNLLPEDSLNKFTRLVLVNAIYFKSRWENVFSAEHTIERPFTALDGTTTAVPMMTQSEHFPYAEIDGHQLIELPYVAEDLGMVVILPAEGEFDQFQAALTVDRLRGMLQTMENQQGSITLPKFSFRSGFRLKQILSDLGMPIAFTRAADFRGMTEDDEGEKLVIDDVYHKTFIGVKEQGTEAAAATGVEIRTVVAVRTPEAPFEMVVDRPFLFLIRDARTETTLFLGRVTDAAEAQATA